MLKATVVWQSKIDLKLLSTTLEEFGVLTRETSRRIGNMIKALHIII